MSGGRRFGLVLATMLVAAAQEPSLPPRPVGLDLYLPAPDSNPLTPDKAALGRRLFFDTGLSRDSTVACASCHLSGHAFGDTLPVARGIAGRQGERNAPPLVNRAWAEHLFWDGRVASLEEQVLHPIRSRNEMDLPLEELERRLRARADYRAAFREAFAGEPEAVTRTTVAYALASFVRSIQAGGSPLDRRRAGRRGTLGSLEERGAALFFGRARCAECHNGPLFTDGLFHNTGVSWGSSDTGRHGVTGADEDRGRFRTPSLRELTRTAPYMHDGSLATLDEVVAFYANGAGANPNLSSRIGPLDLDEADRAALVAFLEVLSGYGPVWVR